MTSPEITDAMVEAAEAVSYKTQGDMRAALSAALAAGAPMSRVKPLEWRTRYFDAEVTIEQASAGTLYQIRDYKGRFWLDIGPDDVGYATLEAAKAVAQADYEARILSALEPAPSALVAEPGEPVAWEQRHRENSGEWSKWYPTSKKAFDLIGTKPDGALQARPLYAAPPARQDGALREARWLLKEARDDIEDWIVANDGNSQSEELVQRIDATLAQSAAPVQPSPAMRETMWGEVVDDDYEGIAFRLTEEGNRDGHHFLKEIALAAETFPLGTKITVASPAPQAAPSGEGE